MSKGKYSRAMGNLMVADFAYENTWNSTCSDCEKSFSKTCPQHSSFLQYTTVNMIHLYSETKTRGNFEHISFTDDILPKNIFSS
jgi:cobalamin biosynthesis Co2+ chelatase CbiK